MTISNKQVSALIELLVNTQEYEDNCDECLVKLAEFAECELVGKSVSESMRQVENHLKVCNECCEEFRALKDLLSRELESSNSYF